MFCQRFIVYLRKHLKLIAMRDFRNESLAIGDRVVYTDSFSRLLEGVVVGENGKFIIVSPVGNPRHQRAVRSQALMKCNGIVDQE